MNSKTSLTQIPGEAARNVNVARDWAAVACMAYQEIRGKSGGMKTALAAAAVHSEQHKALKAAEAAQECLDDLDRLPIELWASRCRGIVDEIIDHAQAAHVAAQQAWLKAAGATGYADYHSPAIYFRGLAVQAGQPQPKYQKSMGAAGHARRPIPPPSSR